LRLSHLVFGLIVIAACGVGTVWLLTPGEADRLREQNEKLVHERAELQRAVERLTAQTRLADVFVLDQTQDGGRATTTVQFVEWDREGRALPARNFVVNDDVIFFDALVIKFDPERVAAGDGLRGKSIALFRRVYGEHQNAFDGQPIDATGQVPETFREDREVNPFEQKLWTRFWDYVSDPNLAAAEGVRIAQGEAVYVRMRSGQQWSISLEHNGGLNIKLIRSSAEPIHSGPVSGSL
jgi:hypothetical protein